VTDPERSLPNGFYFLSGYLDFSAQTELAREIGSVLQIAPLFEQAMPKSGAPLSVKMSNAGEWGWVTDKTSGYRYQRTHPVTNKPWPPIPNSLIELWGRLTGEAKAPNLLLINYYDDPARLGLHQDKGESSLEAPVLSVSLGDDGTFLVGGLKRKDPVQRLLLKSGDVVWFGGPGRLLYHGVESIEPGSSDLLAKTDLFKGGRLNLTLRRINKH
jgi:DNA oxidative demethylase